MHYFEILAMGAGSVRCNVYCHCQCESIWSMRGRMFSSMSEIGVIESCRLCLLDHTRVVLCICDLWIFEK